MSTDAPGSRSVVGSASKPMEIDCGEDVVKDELESIEVDLLRRRKMRKALGEAVGKEEGKNLGPVS